MRKLQEELPPDKYRECVALLAAFRKSKDSHALINGTVQLLRPKQHQHLLVGFQDFIPKADRPWLHNCIR